MTFLKTTLKKITDQEKIPYMIHMAKKHLEPIFKNKEDTMKCGHYRGIKLRRDSMKLYERIPW